MSNRSILVPDEVVLSKIYEIRGQKVMIDRDLAELYGVETRVLNQAVRRNIQRFPEDFMFQMTSDEMEEWKSQIVISNREKMGLRKPPLLFTEQGVTMLSCVLNSERAIIVNIQIIRIFIKLRSLILSHKDLLLKMNDLEKRVGKQDAKIKMIFDYLKQFITEQEKPRTPIGFKHSEKD